MRFSFYAACFAATASATYTVEEMDSFADYLWAQMDAGEMTQEEGFALAEQYADDIELEAELAQEEGVPMEAGQANSDGIIADAKWLGGKMWNGAKAVGRGIDRAYDATKAGIKKAGSAVINAPGNAVKAVKDWKKRHNFPQTQ